MKKMLGCMELDPGNDMVEMIWVMINDQANAYHLMNFNDLALW